MSRDWGSGGNNSTGFHRGAWTSHSVGRAGDAAAWTPIHQTAQVTQSRGRRGGGQKHHNHPTEEQEGAGGKASQLHSVI